MTQEFYNGTNSIFVANDGVLKKTVYEEKKTYLFTHNTIIGYKYWIGSIMKLLGHL